MEQLPIRACVELKAAIIRQAWHDLLTNCRLEPIFDDEVRHASMVDAAKFLYEECDCEWNVFVKAAKGNGLIRKSDLQQLRDYLLAPDPPDHLFK
jgi:hypothetical protein